MLEILEKVFNLLCFRMRINTLVYKLTSQKHAYTLILFYFCAMELIQE